MTPDTAPLDLLLAAMDLVEARYGLVDFDMALTLGWLGAALVDVLAWPVEVPCA